MPVLDFLWQGSPPPAVSTYGVATQNIPQYMSDYVQGLLNRTNAVSSEPFQQYDAPRIAGFNQDQQSAFDATRNMQGQWSPYMQSATNFAGSAGSVNPLQNAQPLINSAQGMNAVGAAQPYMDMSASYNAPGAASPFFNAASSMNAPGAASPFLNAASGMQGQNAASPFVGMAAGMQGQNAAAPYMGAASSIDALGNASPWFGASAMTNPMDAAAPFAQGASGSFQGANVSNYMNPFIDNVVNRTGTMAARQLSEKLMPAINDNFIKAGQFGSTRMQGEVGKALRDTNDSMTEQIGNLYSQGYGQAGQMFGQDQARQAQLAGTMGGLGSNYMSNLSNIGSQMGNLSNQQMGQLGQLGAQMGSLTNQSAANMGNLGQMMGSLTNQSANNLANIGQTFGNLTNAQMQALAGMGSSMGNLTGQQAQNMANIGSQMGNLTNNQMGQMGNLAQLTGNLSNMYATNQRDAASLMSNLGNQQQSLGLRDVAALEGIGNTQQAMDQRNADLAYSDFQEQRDYPTQQLQLMNSMIRGLPSSTTSSTTRTAPGDNFQPSPLAQLAGTTSLLGGLANMRFAKGGPVKKKPRPPSWNGALSYAGG
jgi:hypothetical protein